MTATDDPRFAPGHAPLPGYDLDEFEPDGGRSAILDGSCSLTEWMVWDWTRQVDQRLDHVTAESYDLADRVHALSAMVIVALLLLVTAVTVLIVLTVL